MRIYRLAAIAGLTLAAPLGIPVDARPQGPDTHIDLTRGNIDLSVADGTAVSMAPGTVLGVRTGGTPGAGTDIEVEHGQIYVSNVLSQGPDMLRVHTGGQVWELERGAALFSLTSDGPSATMLHGRSLGVPGGAHRVSRPGQRLQVGPDGAVSEGRADPGEVRAMIRQTGAPGAPPLDVAGGAGREGAPRPGAAPGGAPGMGLGPAGAGGLPRPAGQGLQQRSDALRRATDAQTSAGPAAPGGNPNGPPGPVGNPNVPPAPGGNPNVPPAPGGNPNGPPGPVGNPNVPQVPGGSPGIPAPSIPPVQPGRSPNGPPGPVGNPNSPDRRPDR